MRRFRALALAAVAILSACKDDRAAVDVIGQFNKADKTFLSRPPIKGVLKAGAEANSPTGIKRYESDAVPFVAQLAGGKWVLPKAANDALFASFHELIASGATWPGPQIVPPVRSFSSFAAYSTDPQQTLFDWAQANELPAEDEELGIEDAAWQELVGASYSEDIAGDGSAVATITVDPISTTNPNGVIRLYLNGTLMGTYNPQYEASGYGGWDLNFEAGRSYSYYGGQTMYGYRHTGDPAVLPPPGGGNRVIPSRHPGLGTGIPRRLRPMLVRALLPSAAYAQSNCNAWMRRALISLAMMAVAGYTENPLAFIGSWASTVNSVHAYARCKESQK